MFHDNSLIFTGGTSHILLMKVLECYCMLRGIIIFMDDQASRCCSGHPIDFYYPSKPISVFVIKGENRASFQRVATGSQDLKFYLTATRLLVRN